MAIVPMHPRKKAIWLQIERLETREMKPNAHFFSRVFMCLFNQALNIIHHRTELLVAPLRARGPQPEPRNVFFISEIKTSDAVTLK